MKYPRDPYYLNSELLMKKNNKEDIFDDGFYNMLKLLKENNEPVFEVGFEFGQRLSYLVDNEVEVEGGVEFNPNFLLFKKHSNILKRGWDIRVISLDYWNPKYRKVMFTNHFLDLFSKEDALTLLDKMRSSCGIMYLNENLDLDADREDGVYVIRNDSSSQTKETELPDYTPVIDFTKEFYQDSPDKSLEEIDISVDFKEDSPEDPDKEDE